MGLGQVRAVQCHEVRSGQITVRSPPVRSDQVRSVQTKVSSGHIRYRPCQVRTSQVSSGQLKVKSGQVRSGKGQSKDRSRKDR